MLETFIALLAAHAVADFVLQLDWIVKRKRDPKVFALHIVIVAATAAIALGLWPANLVEGLGAIILVAAAHAGLDAVKTWGRAPSKLVTERGWDFESFSLDQAGHLGAIVIIACLFPNVYGAGVWTAETPGEGRIVTAGLALAAGFLIATRAGQFLIAEFMKRFALKETKDSDDPDRGLDNGGTWIGLLERSLTFCLVLAGRFEAIGFLLAAKSILRFSYAAKDRSHSEYVIIGTLLSFGWAIGVAVLTAVLLRAL